MKTGYKVCDAMTEKPISLGPDATIKECATLMAQQHVGAILVKRGSKLLGIVTEQDIVRKGIAAGKASAKTKISDVMEKEVTTISPEKDIFEALIIMRDLNIRHLPVTDKSSMLGLLTLKDILKIEPQLFDLLVEKIQLREEQRKPINVLQNEEGFCQICGTFTNRLIDEQSVLQCNSCLKSEREN